MRPRSLFSATIVCQAFLTLSASACADEQFAGIVSSASPEATAAGVEMFKLGGNAIDDDGSPFVLATNEMPLSSMTATIVSRDRNARLVLGSPGSARIISAVAQVTSHWIDIDEGIESAVAAFPVHAQPPQNAFVEGKSLSPELLKGCADRNMTLQSPGFGVSDSHYDPYFGGVHALALENGVWTGAADPRRDERVGFANR